MYEALTDEYQYNRLEYRLVRHLTSIPHWLSPEEDEVVLREAFRRVPELMEKMKTVGYGNGTLESMDVNRQLIGSDGCAAYLLGAILSITAEDRRYANRNIIVDYFFEHGFDPTVDNGENGIFALLNLIYRLHPDTPPVLDTVKYFLDIGVDPGQRMDMYDESWDTDSYLSVIDLAKEGMYHIIGTAPYDYYQVYRAIEAIFLFRVHDLDYHRVYDRLACLQEPVRAIHFVGSHAFKPNGADEAIVEMPYRNFDATDACANAVVLEGNAKSLVIDSTLSVYCLEGLGELDITETIPVPDVIAGTSISGIHGLANNDVGPHHELDIQFANGWCMQWRWLEEKWKHANPAQQYVPLQYQFLHDDWA